MDLWVSWVPFAPRPLGKGPVLFASDRVSKVPLPVETQKHLLSYLNVIDNKKISAVSLQWRHFAKDILKEQFSEALRALSQEVFSGSESDSDSDYKASRDGASAGSEVSYRHLQPDHNDHDSNSTSLSDSGLSRMGVWNGK